MSEVPIVEILGGGAFALLVIKEFRMWGKTVLDQRRASSNGNSGTPKRDLNGNLCNSHTKEISSNTTDIKNLKEVYRDSRADNKKEHNEIKELIINRNQ